MGKSILYEKPSNSARLRDAWTQNGIYRQNTPRPLRAAVLRRKTPVGSVGAMPPGEALDEDVMGEVMKA